MLILCRLKILTSNFEPLFLLYIHNLLSINIFCKLHREIALLKSFVYYKAILRFHLVILDNIMQHADIIEKEGFVVAKNIPRRVFKYGRHNIVRSDVALLTYIFYNTIIDSRTSICSELSFCTHSRSSNFFTAVFRSMPIIERMNAATLPPCSWSFTFSLYSCSVPSSFHRIFSSSSMSISLSCSRL